MPRILHLIGAADPDHLRWSLKPLLERLDRKGWPQFVGLLPGGAKLSFVPEAPVRFIRQPAGVRLLGAAAVQRCIASLQIDVVHAWGSEAGYLAMMAVRRTRPLVMTCWDPFLTREEATQAYTLSQQAHIGLLCHAAIVKRRFVERGVALDQCAVVRPGIDFSAINRFKRHPPFDEAENHARVFMPSLPPRRQGARLGLWACAIAKRFIPQLELAISSETPPSSRTLARFAQRMPVAPFLRVADGDLVLEHHLTCSDLVLMPACQDAPTTTLAWAMAASVPILGCANYSITELIADGHNGYLVKANEPMGMAAKIILALQQRGQDQQIIERARTAAFESFGLTRYVEQTQKAYENMLAGAPVGQNLADSALEQ